MVDQATRQDALTLLALFGSESWTHARIAFLFLAGMQPGEGRVMDEILQGLGCTHLGSGPGGPSGAPCVFHGWGRMVFDPSDGDLWEIPQEIQGIMKDAHDLLYGKK